MRYILYLATNKNNGKRYVGVTGRSLKRRMNEHMFHAKKMVNNGHFYKAIRKHGFDCFDFTMIGQYETKDLAFNAEIFYIKENNPEYNSTLGGDGRLGGAMSLEAKQKLKKIHSGNKYRLGKTHDDKTKLILRDFGIKNIAIFKKYMSMGPKTSSKPVICLDDWMVFPSASEAARRYNLCKSSIIELCLGKNNRKKVGGFRFSYYGVE